MDSKLKRKLSSLFSESPTAKKVELDFLKQFFNCVGTLTVRDVDRLVNSGKFNEIFPALDNEASQVSPRRFKDLKPFDYRTWAKRNRIED